MRYNSLRIYNNEKVLFNSKKFFFYDKMKKIHWLQELEII